MNNIYDMYCIGYAVSRSDGTLGLTLSTTGHQEACAVAIGVSDGKNTECYEPRSKSDVENRVKLLCGEVPAAS